MSLELLTSIVEKYGEELYLRTAEHIFITLVTISVAVLIGLPLGILIFYKETIRAPIMGFVNIIQTIPSLAMLMIFLVLFGKIGIIPALAALILYALLPIVRNVFIGLEGIEPILAEASKGIGMTPMQALFQIRLPLAMPVIVGGIRTATVICVGITTLCAFIGAGGLGQFINRGLALSDTKLILLGAIPSALLAIALDFLISLIEKSLKPVSGIKAKKNLQIFRGFLILALLLISLSALIFVLPVNKGSNVIKIGSKNFSEQILLAELMSQVIENTGDMQVKRVFNLGGTMFCHNALIKKEIDIYAEYTGTGLLEVLKYEYDPDKTKVLEEVSIAYKNKFDIEWLKPFDFNNTYAIAVRDQDAKQYNWNKISDLEEFKDNLIAGFTSEFAVRDDAYIRFQKKYFKFAKNVDLEVNIIYDAIHKGAVDIISAYATDGRIKAYNLKILEDDKRIFPLYEPAPIMRLETLKKYPQLEAIFTNLVDHIGEVEMQKLNYQVDVLKRDPAEVAREFLLESGLI